ncbi:MFS transporter [Patellaria atrata CBS 101060]|uniref:MFS transporter n=1 Tax=Patellaria atrata CBS 101060 TaxID=1346257 RepID=A0A9P4VQA5_9PEZI|nr:MFS transporter [Patellaria atrata CBS 101060]
MSTTVTEEILPLPISSEGPQKAQDIELSSCNDQQIERLGAVPAEEPNQIDRNTLFKLLSCGFCFFFAGTNDGAIGPLVPYMLRTYHISTGSIAIIYASTFSGWLLAGLTNSHLRNYLPFGMILLFGSFVQLLAHVLRPWTPPFGLFAASFCLNALGMAYQDSHANTYVSSVKDAHRWLGFIHAMYALGCLVGPFVATAVATSGKGERWLFFYAVEAGLGVANLVGVVVTFWDTLGFNSTAQEEGREGERGEIGKNKEAVREIKETFKLPGLWMLSLFYFSFLGAGITAGGWIVEYLVTIRNGELSKVGYVPSGLWGGVFLGRLLLAEPTYRFGERRMLLLYCVLMLGLQLVFWLVPNIVANATAISVLGFFYGPLFATGISVASKLFPKRVQATALGFIFVLAQSGGAFFPALTGVIASRAGVQVMQPIVVALIVTAGVSWALVPKVPRRDE